MKISREFLKRINLAKINEKDLVVSDAQPIVPNNIAKHSIEDEILKRACDDIIDNSALILNRVKDLSLYCMDSENPKIIREELITELSEIGNKLTKCFEKICSSNPHISHDDFEIVSDEKVELLEAISNKEYYCKSIRNLGDLYDKDNNLITADTITLNPFHVYSSAYYCYDKLPKDMKQPMEREYIRNFKELGRMMKKRA